MNSKKIVERHLTPPDIAAKYGVATAKVIGWIRLGELKALNLANRTCRRPRYSVTPDALEQFEQSRLVIPESKRRRKANPATKDYFSHLPG